MRSQPAALILVALVSVFAIQIAGSTNEGTPPTVILFNGVVVPMTEEQDRFEAIAIREDLILALGADEGILALAGPETELIDLGGAAVYPGFIDPHTHLFDLANTQGMTFDEVQQLALENGITTAANMATAPDEGFSWEIDDFIAYAETGGMRMRMHLYLVHTNSCGETKGFWYEQYTPDEEIALGLIMGGVKIFAERSVCDAERPMVYMFSYEAWRRLPEKWRQLLADATLVRSEGELVEVLERVQANGYQAAIHAIGDLAAETCLNAYEKVLSGEPNTLRHMILHNHFLRDDLLPRYAELGVLALVEMSSPAMLKHFAGYVGEENLSLFRRWSELLDSGAHVALDSDWPWFPISPIDKLRAFVGGESVHPDLTTLCPCPDRVPQTVTMWQALQMMTTNAAYALRVEDRLGTLQPGKLADLVILTGNPLDIAPSRLSELTVTATYVDGELEYSNGDVLPPHALQDLSQSAGQDSEASGEVSVLDDYKIGDMESDIQHACRPFDPSEVGWFASINQDEDADTPENHANITQGTDEHASYYGMEWSSPVYTDLGLNGIDDFDRSGASSIYVTLSASEPMDVVIEVRLEGDYCGGVGWRYAAADPIRVETRAKCFELPVSAFGDSRFGPCRGSLPENALEAMHSIVLLPAPTSGEIRVYESGICGESLQSDP